MLLLKFYQYTRYYEMPQKACETGFCHVIAFSQFFRNTPFFLSDSENGKNGAFQKIRTLKIGAFQKKLARDQFGKIGHFKKLRKCYHMTKSSFTCFLGH